MKTLASSRSVNYLNKSISNQASQANSSLALYVHQLSLGNFAPLENYLRDKLLLIDDSEMRKEVIENFFVKLQNLIQTIRHKAAMEHDLFELENMDKCEFYLPILKRKFAKLS